MNKLYFFAFLSLTILATSLANADDASLSPDLTISKIGVLKNMDYFSGEVHSVSFLAAIRNLGDIASKPSVTYFKVEGASFNGEYEVYTGPVSTKMVSIKGTPFLEKLPQGIYTITVIVDYHNDLEESDESNNIYIGEIEL